METQVPWLASFSFFFFPLIATFSKPYIMAGLTTSPSGLADTLIARLGDEQTVIEEFSEPGSL